MEIENEAGKVAPDTEEAADFARLGAMVGEAEAAPGGPVAEPEQPKADAAESMGALLTMAGAALGVVGMTRTAEVWKPETCAEVAARVVPVLRKYPWGARILGFFETGAGAEEMALAACLVPVGLATYAAVSADLAPRQAEETKRPEAAAGQVAKPAEFVPMEDVHGVAG